MITLYTVSLTVIQIIHQLAGGDQVDQACHIIQNISQIYRGLAGLVHSHMTQIDLDHMALAEVDHYHMTQTEASFGHTIIHTIDHGLSCQTEVDHMTFTEDQGRTIFQEVGQDHLIHIEVDQDHMSIQGDNI